MPRRMPCRGSEGIRLRLQSRVYTSRTRTSTSSGKRKHSQGVAVSFFRGPYQQTRLLFLHNRDDRNYLSVGPKHWTTLWFVKQQLFLPDFLPSPAHVGNKDKRANTEGSITESTVRAHRPTRKTVVGNRSNTECMPRMINKTKSRRIRSRLENSNTTYGAKSTREKELSLRTDRTNTGECHHVTRAQ